MIKPDGVQRKLIGRIIGRFESKGLFLRAMKMTKPSLHQLEQHYFHLKTMPFYQNMIDFMSSGPVVAMVREHI